MNNHKQSIDGTAGRKILIVDDDPSGTQLLSTLVELVGDRAFQPEDWGNPLT